MSRPGIHCVETQSLVSFILSKITKTGDVCQYLKLSVTTTTIFSVMLIATQFLWTPKKCSLPTHPFFVMLYCKNNILYELKSEIQLCVYYTSTPNTCKTKLR